MSSLAGFPAVFEQTPAPSKLPVKTCLLTDLQHTLEAAMDKRIQKLLLVLITLALAVLPLRGAWSIVDFPATDTESHCAQMQHAMQDTSVIADMQQHESGDSAARNCEQGCDGSCCDDACSTCVPGTSAISNTLALTSEVSSTPHNKVIPVAFSGQIVIPLLRPPASL